MPISTIDSSGLNQAGNTVLCTTSGNVGIGTSSPGSNRLYINAPDGTAPLTLNSAGGSDTTRALNFNVAGDNYGKILVPSGSGGAMAFWTGGANAAAERARIDSSGNFMVGTTSLVSTSRGAFYAAVNGNAAEFKVATNGYGLVFFSAASAFVGSIAINSASVAYNTSSDYRLKHDIAPMTGALAKVAALKPVTYKWNIDDSASEGFIAHELAEVVPDAVTGEKDAVDADGNPKYQGIDTSFLVATLTAAIQELKAINDAQAQTITALTARVTALEGTQP